MFNEILARGYAGELYFDNTLAHQSILKVYATDASVYQEKPLAVALPRTANDIKILLAYAAGHNLTVIPRAAGTSLAGQVVGKGIVVDISKHFNNIVELDTATKRVRVQPGIIRDDLNAYLKPFGLMFGPETSTSNRAMIGGMIGNNSCGLHSIIWGNTRDNLVSANALLADGSEVTFEALDADAVATKASQYNKEGEIYRELLAILNDPEAQHTIRTSFPKPSIRRRNSGYALDALLQRYDRDRTVNLCELAAGSEGTLCFVTEATLQLIDLPPVHQCVVAVHCTSIHESLLANLVAMQHQCTASELVDHFILEFTKDNPEHAHNRFFINGHPKAILMVEFFASTAAALDAKAAAFIDDVRRQKLGYHYPVLQGEAAKRAWDVRKAGLGLLRNQPGDVLPVNLIEDCAVDVDDLPHYIADLEALLQSHNVPYAMYAHAGAGELHVEPMLNLKTAEGRGLFRGILDETVTLLKKYNGALSGEHGDGRLRGEFIPKMMGDAAYALFKQVKKLFDPGGVLNAGKITDTPRMDESFRFEAAASHTPATTLSFTRYGTILGLAERCSGSGDCRKTEITGGTMCPSYMATRHEKDTTRARANILRQFYTGGATPHEQDLGEVRNILDLCLSCKGCKTECPSGVDVANMKAEFTQQYYDRFGASFRARLIASFTSQMSLASKVASIYNGVAGSPALRKVVARIAGFHPKRSLPLLARQRFDVWLKKAARTQQPNPTHGYVHIFCDEFTTFNDADTGMNLVRLLAKLGYGVKYIPHGESGRTYLSKGFVKQARDLAVANVNTLAPVVSAKEPVIGIEPSAILTLRDEYVDLVPAELREKARQLARHVYTFEEWMAREVEAGNISPAQFSNAARRIVVHEHCHQKALSAYEHVQKCLGLFAGSTVTRIPSGCCGMAGSFGYEKEHYDVSMQIGELVLLPFVRKEANDTVIVASGTSCRHQIKDGTGRTARHLIDVMHDAAR